jgi:hypothetical protein
MAHHLMLEAGSSHLAAQQFADNLYLALRELVSSH